MLHLTQEPRLATTRRIIGAIIARAEQHLEAAGAHYLIPQEIEANTWAIRVETEAGAFAGWIKEA
jgi:hypothetical protein